MTVKSSEEVVQVSRQIFTRETLIPVGLAIAIIAPIAAGAITFTIWINDRLHTLDKQSDTIRHQQEAQQLALNNSLEDVSEQIAQLQVVFKNAISEQYTLAAASEVASRNALRNPDQVVTDPRNPNRVLENAAGRSYMRNAATGE